MDNRDDLRIHLDNLREFSLRSKNSEAQRELVLLELADILISELEQTDGELSDVYKRFRALHEDIGNADLARFAQRLAREYETTSGGRKKLLNEDKKTVAPGSHGKIATVKNSYCEDAFAILSRTVKAPKRIYAQSFSDACEEIATSSCEFALLPIESAQNGRLFGFYSLLDRYELKIFAACLLEGEGYEDSIRYALVGKSSPDRLPRNARLTFEFSLISDSDSFPSDVLTAAAVLSASIVKIDSLPVAYDDTQRKYFFTLNVTDTVASALDIYLSCEHKGYTRIGLYPIIK